ncbi:MAG: sodium:solute symporter [Chitinophagales bacterium]
MLTIILFFVFLYFATLLGIAFYTARGAGNESFFIGERKSNWLLVAYGMIGTSLSGVTFMSVPGEVQAKGFGYMQVVLGYFIGYLAVAFVLLPLYYRLQLTSIYAYLRQRLGETSYKTGASFFLISRTLGASIRIYLVLMVLHHFLLEPHGIPFAISAAVILLMIWLYTFNGGVKTIIWTDTLQTTGMLLALVITIIMIRKELQLPFGEMLQHMQQKGYTNIFQYQDWKAGNFFLKQIIGGAFITITMTGLDQEMMQKNISVSTLWQSQKNMLLFSVIVMAANLLFLIMGGALYLYSEAHQIVLPARSDETFPLIALQYLPPVAGVVFVIGLISALFPSADGALTALTSSFCIDILDFDKKQWEEVKKLRIRRMVHIAITILFFALIISYQQLIKDSVISAILKVASFTYGPLLGLFCFGIFTKRRVRNALVPMVCILSPILCFVISEKAALFLGNYKIGLELLLLNGGITFAGLFFISNAPSTSK